jgi:hypothetical protein
MIKKQLTIIQDLFAGKLFAEESLLSFLHLMIFLSFYVPGTYCSLRGTNQFVDPDPGVRK